jgi:predicted dehydrogenase
MKENTTHKVRIAQIGIGYWGPNLLRNLVANEFCDVVRVVDLSEEQRAFVKALYPSITVSGQAEDILSDSTIQAVVIATPVASHFELAIKCLEAGKSIMVEKPMATSATECAGIGALAERNSLVAMVGHTFLYNSSVRYVKDLIDNGSLGDVRYIYSQRLNLGRIRSDVDALWNLAPHDVSIIQFWLGEPEPVAVERFGNSYVQEGIDDVVFMNIKYQNGVMANIHVSWLDPHKTRKMAVVGSEKMVVYDDVADSKITIYDKGIDRMSILGENMDFDDSASFTFNHRSGDIVLPKVSANEPLAVEVAHFIDCVMNGTRCLTDASHAERVVRILELGSRS